MQAAGAEARKAEMEAAAQDVARYTALEAFKRVVAPFDGVVTARLLPMSAATCSLYCSGRRRRCVGPW